MKKLLLLIISLIFITALSAQDAGLSNYVLSFTDKGVSKISSLNPLDYLSDKAVERRLKFEIPFDEDDIPVRQQYITDVTNTGAKVLTRSRWFNNIVIEANADMISEISGLPFILNIQPLEKNLKSQYTPISSEKPYFETETISPWIDPIPEKGISDIYDYGTAYNQIHQLKGEYLHNIGYSGEGMLIAVIDAGFNSVNVMPCFQSLRDNNQIKGTHDFADPGNDVYATTMASHGTSVLSCMAANVSGQMVGTAPKADYWLLRSEVGATESIIEEYYWVSAAEFADSVGADLINSSLGYTTFDDPSTNHTYADMDGKTTVVTLGADKAAQKGILVVNSAGNSGESTWLYISAPADGDSVFTVGAVDAAGIRSSFSSIGPTYDGRFKPEVMAQGTGAAIYSPDGLGSGNGTSFSSPIMCGITACFWQAFPGLTNMQIIDMIKASSSQASSPDNFLGWGIPDFELASATLSYQNQSVEKNITLYPNPVFDKLTIGLPFSLQGRYDLKVLNVEGKVVYSLHNTEGSIRSIQLNDIGYLTSGIYFIQVSDHNSVYSGKFLKI
jgi:hypothetical protein